MLQTVSIRRVETRQVLIDVCQPLTKETLTALVNGQLTGIASPGPASQVSSSLGAWVVTSAKPECECTSAPTKKSNRKGK